MQQLNPSEISEIIKQRIDNLTFSTEAQNEGTVVSVTDGIIRIHGLAEVMYGEMIEFEGGVTIDQRAVVIRREKESHGAVTERNVLDAEQRVVRGDRLGLVLNDGRQRLGRRPALERATARHHLVEN